MVRLKSRAFNPKFITMDNSIIEISARGMALVPLTVALVAGVRLLLTKEFGSYIAPILSVLVGGVLSYLAGGITFLDSQILGGLVVGLMAAGLYSGGKTLAGY